MHIECVKREYYFKRYTKRKLKRYKSKLLSPIDKSVPLSAKKRIIVQRGGFLLPLLTADLPTLPSLIF